MPNNNNRINFQVGYNVDQASVNAVKKSLQDLQNIKLKDFNGPKKDLDDIKQKANQVEAALNKAFNVNLNSLNTQAFNAELQKAGLSVDKIYTSFSKAGAQGQVAFSRMASEVLTTNMQLKQTNSLVSQMGETMANTVKWGIASSVMNNFTNSVQQAFQYVKSLDSALTDIRIVTGDSTEQMKEFAVQANNAAQSLGRSTMDYTKAALTFYQQGLNEEDVQARTQAVLKAQNITGAGDEMADYLTAVWNGYKVANEEAELYVDKLASVADSSASNMSQLAIAMSKVASTANAMGVDVDQLNAQIATIVATTRQAPESVGNALKTIYSRINDISTGAEDAEVSLGNYSKQMAAVGFNVLDANGNLRDTGEVIEEIGGKWADLSREQQIYLARTMAGQRQYNNLIALFDNWSRYSDLVNVSMDSQGTLMEKNSRYMESLGAKMEQLGAAGERVKSAMINEEDLKGLVDFGTGAVNLFGSLIESIGGGRGALLAFGSIFTQVFSGTISKQINNAIINFQNAKNNIQLLKQDVANLQTFQNVGAENPAVKQLTKYMGQLQKYYSVLDEASINNQKNLINELDQLENSKILLQDKRTEVERYAAVVGEIDVNQIWEKESDAVLNLNAAIGDLEGSSSNLRQLYNRFQQTGQITDKLTEGFNQFLASYRNLNPDNAVKLQQAFANIESNPSQLTSILSRALDEADLKAKQYTNTINTAVQEQQNLNNKTSQLKNIIQNNNKGFQQLFNVTNIVNGVAALGQFAAGINSIINLTKVWQNENTSTGQKILQTFTNLGMTIPMIINSLSRLRTSLGLETGVLQTILLLEKRRTLEKEKQALIQQHQNRLSIGNETYLNSSLYEEIRKKLIQNQQALDGVNTKILLSKQSFISLKDNAINALKGIGNGIVTWFTNPITAIPTIVGVAAVAIGVTLYKAWNQAADAAEKAAQKTKKAQEAYNSLKESSNNLKTSLDNLASAKDHFNELTKGTQQWRTALQEVNDQVLSLMQEFPELRNYVDSTSEGLLYITEEGQRVVQQAYQQRSIASGLAYANADRASTEAQNYSLITNASRDLDGAGGLTPDQLKEVVDAVNQHGEYILENSKWLDKNTNLSSKDIQVVQENTGKISELANQVNANTTASQNLTSAILRPELANNSLYQNSSNQDAFVKLVQNSLKNVSLDDSYYTDIGVDLYNNQLYRHLDLDSLAQAWAEDLGKTFGQDVRVKGIGAFKKIQQKVDGQWQNVSTDLVVGAVAYQDAVENIDSIYQQVNQQIQSLGEKSSSILTAFGDNLENFDWSKFSISDIKQALNNDELINIIADSFQVNPEDVQRRLKNSYQDMWNGYINYLQQLPKSVKESLEKYVSEQPSESMSEQMKEAIGSLLRNSYSKGLEEFKNTQDLLEGLDIQEILPFQQVVNSLTGTDISINSFKDALLQAGVTLENVSDDQLQIFIDQIKAVEEAIAPEEFYKSIHDIIDGLKIGDTIDAEQAATLEAAGIELSAYFDRFPDGTLKLRQSVEDFVNYANNISLQPLVNKLNSLSEQVAIKENFENSSYSSSQGGNFQDFSQAAIENNGAELFSTQLAFLQAIDEITPEIQEGIQELSKTQIDWNNLTEEQKEIITQVSQEVSKHKPEWQANANAISQAKEEIEKYSEQLSNATRTLETLDQDVKQDQWKDLSQYLQDYADNLEEVSDNVQDNDQVANELAESLLRYDHALEEVIDHQDEWQKMLNSDAIQDRVEAGNQLQGVYADLLDLPFESLSPDFTQDIDNFNLLKAAVQGDEQAYNQLAEAARQDIIAHIELKDADAFYNQLNNVQSMMDQMNFQDIQIGAVLDDTNFIAGLQNMVNAAGMTAQQATDYLASMGVDAQVIENNAPSTETKETTGWTTTLSPVTEIGTAPALIGPGLPFQVPIVYRTYQAVYTPQLERTTSTSDNKAVSLKVTSAHKSSGGGFKYKQASHGGGSKSPSSSRKGGGGGGGSKAKNPTTVKPQKLSDSKKPINDRSDVYHDINLELQKQEDILDDIQKEQKKLVNKDRLKNLQQQNKQLEKQKDLLDQKSGIAATELVRLRNELVSDLGNSISFDPNGQIANYNKALDDARDNYNNAIANYNKQVWAAEEAYNRYVDQYNSMSAETQEANKAELERQKDIMDQTKKSAQTSLDLEKDKYDAIKDNIKQYEDTLELQRDIANQQQQIQDKIYENLIAMSKIKVDLSIDTGDFERDWLNFENKFIKKLDKDDFLGNAKASAKELMSYFNSKQIQETADEIKKIRNEINIMNKGGTSSIYGNNLAQAQEDLEDYMKQQMDDLADVQDLVDDIKDNYLDTLDNAKDKMDDQIDQYERVNDLIDHNVKLTQMLYGDKAYNTMDKYYELRKANNKDQLESLRMQQQYWQNLFNGIQRDKDGRIINQQEYDNIKKNLDDVTDNLNSKLEEMIENLSDQWQNRVDGIIAKLNNALTGGRGLDFLDEQWDYINNFDDNFLDTFESKMGIQEVTDLYQQAIDGLSGSPANQQKINKLMNEQLKILREKDNLTQYDIDRAKAALEVQKARMALEDTRYNKTKMRLRRDSQGNYTYQYVADEEKLGDLQAALADAQANLYNMDKEHYTQNLNTLYDAYKDYIDKMRELTEEYNSTQDKEQRARIQGRIDLLRESTNKLMQGLTEDNRYALQYLNESFFGGMGIDTTLLSADEQMEIMTQNIPQMQSNIQDLANTLVGEGGILNATNDAMREISDATIEYDANVRQFLQDAGSSLEIVTNVTDAAGNALDQNVVNAQNLITANDELIKSCEAQVAAIQELMSWLDQYMNKVMNVQTLVANLRSAYGTGQQLNGSNLTADVIPVESMGLDTTTGMNFTGNPATDAAAVKQEIDRLMAQYEQFLKQMSIATFDTGGSTGSWGDASGRLAFLHEKELVLNQQDTANILAAVNAVRMITGSLNGLATGEIGSLINNATGLLGGIDTNNTLDQNVHIEANFPNVTQHTEIEQAFNNLVNMASMRASGYRD